MVNERELFANIKIEVRANFENVRAPGHERARDNEMTK